MLPADLLSNLGYIELLTKKRIHNLLLGSHMSVLKGHGYDFVEHKHYVPGDDLRRVDWNALARTGELLVKQTHEERELDVHIAVDLSRSMELGTARYSKRELLLYVTAALAYSALADEIRVGLVGFTDRIELEISPQKGKLHLWNLLETLWTVRPKGKATDLAPALERLSQRTSRLSIVFIVSDFLFPTDVVELDAFRALAARHDVIPIVVTDPAETALPKGHGWLTYRDLETGQRRLVRLDRANQTAYQQWIRDRRRALRAGFYRLNLDFLEVRTDRSFHDLIAGLFLTRRRQ